VQKSRRVAGNRASNSQTLARRVTLIYVSLRLVSSAIREHAFFFIEQCFFFIASERCRHYDPSLCHHERILLSSRALLLPSRANFFCHHERTLSSLRAVFFVITSAARDLLSAD